MPSSEGGRYVVLLAALLGCGCRDSASGVDGGGKADTTSPTVAVSARLFDRRDAPIAGWSVCVFLDGKKTSSCTSTDASGRFTIAVPRRVETGLQLEKQGYGPTLMPIWTVATGPINIGDRWQMTTTAETLGLFTESGVTPDASKGLLVVNAVGGATFALTPPAGKGPFYASDSDVLTPSLTALGSIRPWGAVLDLAPGAYDVIVNSPGQACTKGDMGWPSLVPQAVRIPVLAGYGSPIIVPCS